MFIYLFCLLLPILGAFRFNIVGELNFAEPLVLVLAVVFLRSFITSWYREPVVRQITWLALLWLASQVGTDIFRGIDQIDYLRGWFRIVVLIASYIVCSVVVGANLDRALFVIFGVMIQPIVNYYYYQPDIPFYKFVLGFFVSLFAFLVARIFSGHRHWWPAIFPLAAAVIALFLNCRSLAGITLSAAAYYSFLGMGLIKNDSGWKSRALFAGVWAAVALAMIQVYTALAGAGHLSEDAVEKYENQVDYAGHFSLLAGRSEVLFSGPKIMQSPIVGWGSWVKDSVYVGERAEALGMDAARAIAETGGIIPSHSHLMGSWLEAGIFGGLFWAVVLFYIGKILVSGSLSLIQQWAGVIALVLIIIGWDIMFSPFGGERRFNDGLYLWIISLLIIIPRHDQMAKKSRTRVTDFGRGRSFAS
jgi:hypothetical protein